MMNNIAEMASMVQQIRQDPVGMLSKRFNLPQNLPKDPNEIIQYLLNSGQVSQAQVNNAMQLKNQFFRK